MPRLSACRCRSPSHASLHFELLQSSYRFMCTFSRGGIRQIGQNENREQDNECLLVHDDQRVNTRGEGDKGDSWRTKVALQYLLLPGDCQEICSVELTHKSIKHSSTCRDSRTKSPSDLVAIPLSSFGASQKECEGKTCQKVTIASLENRKSSSRQPRLLLWSVKLSAC
jgi:hypothetical protein